MPAVEVRDLCVRYGDLVAVDGVSFDAAAGQVTVVLGPNGAGKTSTVECCEGFRRPVQGQVRVLGHDPLRERRQVVGRMGVMLQDGGVYTGIRPPEMLRLFAAYYDRPRDPDELLELVGLGHRRRTTWRRLSGGEKQRLSLALALVGRPEVLFLDEPTAGIDVEGRELIRSLVGGLRDEGVCVVLTTHDLDEAERVADRVVILSHGKVAADATLAELGQGSHPAELTFRAAPGLDTAALGSQLGGPVVEEAAGAYRVGLAPDPATVAALTSWLAERSLPLDDLQANRRRLDDVFRRVTAEGGEQ